MFAAFYFGQNYFGESPNVPVVLDAFKPDLELSATLFRRVQLESELHRRLDLSIDLTNDD